MHNQKLEHNIVLWWIWAQSAGNISNQCYRLQGKNMTNAPDAKNAVAIIDNMWQKLQN